MPNGASDWPQGYRAAVRDIGHLARARGLLTPAWEDLFRDMEHDAHVIGHELNGKARRASLTAAREALAPELFVTPTEAMNPELFPAEPVLPRIWLTRPT